MPLEVDHMEYANDAAAQAAYVTDGIVAYDSGKIFPNADETVTWTPSAGADRFATIDEDPSNDADYNSHYNTSGFDRFTFSPPSLPSDLQSISLQMTVRAWRGATEDTSFVGCIWISDGANPVRYDTVGFATTGSAQDFVHEWTTNPRTGLPWTVSQMDGQNVANHLIYIGYYGVTGSIRYQYVSNLFVKVLGDKPVLNSFSEATIKTQGSYALKGIAAITESLNKVLTRIVSPVINLTDKTIMKFDMRASRTGSNLKLGIHDSGGVTTEITPNIVAADTYQLVVWDLSAVANADKDAIDWIKITVLNADAANTFYLDNMFADIIEQFLIHRGRDRFRFKGYSLG